MPPPQVRLSKVNEFGEASLKFTNKMAFKTASVQRLMTNSTIEGDLADPILRF